MEIQSWIFCIPREVIKAHIFEALSASELINFMMVCKFAYEIVFQYLDSTISNVQDLLDLVFAARSPMPFYKIKPELKINSRFYPYEIRGYLRSGFLTGLTNRTFIRDMIGMFKNACPSIIETYNKRKTPRPDLIAKDTNMIGIALIFKLSNPNFDFETAKLPWPIDLDCVPDTKDNLYYYSFLFNQDLFWKLVDDQKSSHFTPFALWVLYQSLDPESKRIFKQYSEEFLDGHDIWKKYSIKKAIMHFDEWGLSEILEYMQNVYDPIEFTGTEAPDGESDPDLSESEIQDPDPVRKTSIIRDPEIETEVQIYTQRKRKEREAEAEFRGLTPKKQKKE